MNVSYRVAQLQNTEHTILKLQDLPGAYEMHKFKTMNLREMIDTVHLYIHYNMHP